MILEDFETASKILRLLSKDDLIDIIGLIAEDLEEVNTAIISINCLKK